MGTRRAAAAGSDSRTGGGEEQRADAENDLMVAVGDVIDSRYRVERVLGSGAMGMVVLAEHIDLKEKRAIKLMHRRSLGDTRAVERFVREARASASVESPFITHVFDLGRLPDGVPFIVMEALDGCDLRELLERRGSLELDETIGMMLQVLSGLAEAHDKRIVHRDLKPSNLFVVRRASRSVVKILDFGIAKVRGGSGEVTTDSDVLGSPLYMAPEQVRSTKDVDARADIWSMGTILYRCLTGRNAFSGDTVADIMVDVLTTEPTPLRALKPAVPEALDELVIACLSKQARARPQSARALSKALLASVPPDVAERAQAWLEIDTDEPPSTSTASVRPRSSAARGPDSVATARATKVEEPPPTVRPRDDAAAKKPGFATVTSASTKLEPIEGTQTATVREVAPKLDRTLDGADTIATAAADDAPPDPVGRRASRWALPFIAAALGVGAIAIGYVATRPPNVSNETSVAAASNTASSSRAIESAPKSAAIDAHADAASTEPHVELAPATATPTSAASSPPTAAPMIARDRPPPAPPPPAQSIAAAPASTSAASAPSLRSTGAPSDPTRIRK